MRVYAVKSPKLFRHLWPGLPCWGFSSLVPCHRPGGGGGIVGGAAWRQSRVDFCHSQGSGKFWTESIIILRGCRYMRDFETSMLESEKEDTSHRLWLWWLLQSNDKHVLQSNGEHGVVRDNIMISALPVASLGDNEQSSAASTSTLVKIWSHPALVTMTTLLLLLLLPHALLSSYGGKQTPCKCAPKSYNKPKDKDHVSHIEIIQT